MVIRQREPVNFEYPFDQLDTFLTPSSLFYIRSHFKAPVLEKHSYELRVGGAVATPLSLRYEDLRGTRVFPVGYSLLRSHQALCSVRFSAICGRSSSHMFQSDYADSLVQEQCCRQQRRVPSQRSFS
jgi:hypothetical protein